MRKIRLSDGSACLVDSEDFPFLSEVKWSAQRPTGYAMNRARGYLHRFLLGARAGEIVDHINGNPKDNRKANLRITDGFGNARNSRAKRPGRRFKGVFWHTRRWMAQIVFNKKSIYLGRFGSQEDAARAYDKAARKYFGEFARLNFNE